MTLEVALVLIAGMSFAFLTVICLCVDVRRGDCPRCLPKDEEDDE